MTYPTWPTEIGAPLRDGYRRDPLDPRQVKAKELGPPESKGRRTLVAERLQMVFRLARPYWAILHRFHRVDLNHGESYFWMPDWGVDGAPLLTETFAPLLTETDTPILISAQMLCHMTEPPADTNLRGTTYDVAVTVDKLP